MSYLKIIGGILLAILLIVISLVRVAFEVIGASTAPDDFALLKQRMPDVLSWLFTTPWPVPTLMLIVIAGLATWLLVSGTRKAASEGIEDAEDHNRLTRNELDDILNQRLADLPKPNFGDARADISKAIGALQFDDHKNAVIAALERNADSTRGAKKYAEATTAALSQLHTELKERVETLIAYSEQTRREMHERIDWIGQAFIAVGHWDWHKVFYPQLVADGDELCRLVDSPITDETWQEWNNLEKHWRGKLDQWLLFAEYYAPNTTEAVKEIKDHIYYSESWSFDESIFGKADRVRRYKELAIAVINLKEVKGHVERGIRHAAFEGVGKRGRQDAPPRLGASR